MSSSVDCDYTLFLNLPKEEIHSKILKFCKTNKGKNLDEDMAYQYLRYFEEDDNKLNEIKNNYINEKMSEYEIKKYLFNKIWKVIEEVQNCRKNIDKNVFDEFYKLKKIELPKPKMKEMINEHMII